ncbi:hypothetical protein [Candidatus Laterigemmans baculatus]|uniref:hypothetical protein n=1 Tax=Candidatus Laterigemmans baculatus TaxID=2770505 RepID=UPI0013DCF795|nr:hypothetical protein [Candidatus Laterigemmans baculatus]
MSRAEENRRRAGRWRRFSVRFVLAITACCAVLLGIWNAYYDVPETHQIPAYEKAPGTRALTAPVGPNQIRIRSIARNRRDGNIELRAGPGLARSGPFPHSGVIAASGPWLDVYQFELEPGTDRVEIIEARVFDHATRTMLTSVSPAFGWQTIPPVVTP